MWMTVNNEDDVNDVTILAMRRVWKLGARILWVMAAVSRRGVTIVMVGLEMTAVVKLDEQFEATVARE